MNFKFPNKVLFIDVETVPLEEDFNQLPKEARTLFSDKTRYQRNQGGTEIPSEEFYEKAGIWAEFGKVVCISIGYYKKEAGAGIFRKKSFYGDEEYDLLVDFKNFLDTHFYKRDEVFCGHNIKEFDIPFLARRMIIQGIPLPEKLKLFGKKPWEVPYIDTMELWKFGDYKHFTSLKLLAYILGIPSPKDDIDGSQVAHVYYKEKDLQRIVTYCEKDILTVAKVFTKLQGQKKIE